MIFQELKTGNYFRIPGINAGYVYRKASDSHCSLNGMLQPIRSHTPVKNLTSAEISDYFAQRQFELRAIKNHPQVGQ